MAKQLMDDESGLKRRARRRLVGAVALATATVVLLPMLLDSEPKQAGQDIELRIPGKDKVAEFAPQLPLPSAPVESLAASSVEAVSAPVAASQVGAVPVAAASSPVAVPQAEVAGQQAGFVVQIGAFANADSARQLQKKLGKQGIKAYTEKADDKTRVRAGPYATREAADKVVHKLEKQGLKPVVSQSP